MRLSSLSSAGTLRRPGLASLKRARARKDLCGQSSTEPLPGPIRVAAPRPPVLASRRTQSTCGSETQAVPVKFMTRNLYLGGPIELLLADIVGGVNETTLVSHTNLTWN